ncbi:type III pantothenate kinase [Vulgatibacter incomptus]|uniref:Type III pantothenate kinase n=1 Tax=Vulgatibacter incomptus TaxID=1391653 RepID=A0A0K1PEY1_9BACT|nr:type III pantothenate kinase [Vulgatibacter incomptus]AKU91674.1 Pantothenate kinase type III, CoaX-like [Vulgatibacter incomptus]
MLLTVDVGNTNTTIGAFRGKELVHQFRLETNHHRTSDEWGLLCQLALRDRGVDPAAIEAVAVSSVVPPLQHTLERMSQRYFRVKPLFVGPGVKTGMPILYDDPREVGADRIVNAVAAYDRWPGPLIVVDFGTAITFDLITAKGEYLGGAIAPGIQIAVDALSRSASRLPRVDLDRPTKAIGRNTISSMQSGIIYGYAAMVDGLCGRLAREMGGAPPKVVATGGLAPLLAGVSEAISEVDECLTLSGLRLIHERNR